MDEGQSSQVHNSPTLFLYVICYFTPKLTPKVISRVVLVSKSMRSERRNPTHKHFLKYRHRVRGTGPWGARDLF